MVLPLHNIPVFFAQVISLRDLYFQWESSGVFEFFLPALLIFAVIFGILSATKILGENRGIHILISAAIAIIAIRTPFVSEFFTTVFPGLGVGIAVLLIALILAGLFIQKGNIHIFSNVFTWGGLGLAAIIIIAALNGFDWFGSIWWQENWVTIAVIAIAVGIISAFLVRPKTFEEKQKQRLEYKFPWLPGMASSSEH